MHFGDNTIAIGVGRVTTLYIFIWNLSTLQTFKRSTYRCNIIKDDNWSYYLIILFVAINYILARNFELSAGRIEKAVCAHIPWSECQLMLKYGFALNSRF